MYTKLLQIIATIDWTDPEKARQKMQELVKEIEDKINALDTRVTELEG